MSFGTLTIATADGRSRSVPIDKAQLRIGRNPDNDVVIDDPSVSGYHARIFAGSNGLSILDIGSRNGTAVDGRQITAQTPLSASSQIRIGAVGVSVAPAGAAPSAPFVLPEFPVAAAAASAATATTVASAPSVAAGPPLVRLDFVPSAARADISAGGPAVLSYSATVQNLSRFVDRLDVAVEGPPWLAATVDPTFHNLQPGHTGQSRITLSVPRAPEATAGVHTLELVVRSQKRPELRFTAASELSVTPFTDFRFELLDPKARTAWTGGRFRVQVTNLSNRVLPFNLEGQNTDGALSFRFDPDPIELKAGERGQSELRARFGLARLFGQQKTYDFTLTGEPLDQSAPIQQAQGRFIQRPPMPPWLLVTGTILTLLALLTACSSFVYRSRGDIFRAVGLLFPSPVVTLTPTLALAPSIDPAGTASAAQTTGAAEIAAVEANLAQTADAVAGENSGTQTAVSQSGATTLANAQTSAAGTQVAAGTQAAGTQIAQGTQAAGTQTAAASQFAATATAQANATGTAIAGTLTALALTPSAGPLTPTTPVAPVGPATGQVISFDRLRGLAVNQRVPIRGDEYAGQDAFFCFYQPDDDTPLAISFAPRQQADGVTITDVTQAEGSGGGTTNFVFTITWVDTPIVIGGGGPLARPAMQQRVLTVDYRTADGGPLPPGGANASSPGDYQPISGSAVIVLASDERQGQATVAVPVVADDLFEPTEVFSLVLSNARSSTGEPVNLLRAAGVGTILNDDQPPTTTPTPVTPTITPTFTPVPDPVVAPPAGDAFDCQPQAPGEVDLILRRAVIYPPPVVAANNAPQHSLTTDSEAGRLLNDAIAVINFQRNVAEVNVNVWYPGGQAAAYVLFAFDERGQVIATARRDAIGVPAAYQLNIRSLERPVRQVVIEARREFAGEFSGDYRYDPVVPPLLTRVEFRYTNP